MDDGGGPPESWRGSPDQADRASAQCMKFIDLQTVMVVKTILKHLRHWKQKKVNSFFYHVLLISNLLDLLGSELGQTLADILPGLVAIDKRLDSLQDLVFGSTDLLGGIAVAQSESVVLNGLEVDGDTERCAELVVAGVTLSDTGGRVVHTVGNTKLAQLGGQTLGQRLEGGVGGEGNQQDLCRGNSGRERKNLL
jgi:hypothetical protein